MPRAFLVERAVDLSSVKDTETKFKVTDDVTTHQTDEEVMTSEQRDVAMDMNVVDYRSRVEAVKQPKLGKSLDCFNCVILCASASLVAVYVRVIDEFALSAIMLRDLTITCSRHHRPSSVQSVRQLQQHTIKVSFEMIVLPYQ